MPSVFVNGYWPFNLPECHAGFCNLCLEGVGVVVCFPALHHLRLTKRNSPFFFSTWHFILAWWIFKLCIYSHLFPERHIELSNRLFKAVFVTIWSFILGIYFSRSLGGCTCSGFYSVDFSQAGLFVQTYVVFVCFFCFFFFISIQLHDYMCLNKSFKQHLTKQLLYSHLPPILKTIQIRRIRHAGHYWRS